MSLTASITPRTPFLPAKIPTISIRTRRRCLQIRTRTRTRTRTRSSLDDAFKTLISLDLVPSALALSLASAASALFLSRAQPVPEPYPKPAADWVLFTSPTPFNRSVLLRCPSVSFVDPDESERLLSEERHYVNVTRGCVPAREGREGGAGEVEGVGYQRVCVGTEDGGVVSLDWPESLDMGKEYGLDTTVLIVPGTAEGSADGDVRLFVADALRKGCFPIVMNPRGCAGSPLTTPRLFTAADSDDIRTAVQYVSRFRPWATLMGVGWGYGANMLTKYLAEVGETTPLTAAVCIDNPFDLEEATRSFPHHSAMDQKLTGGLKEILGANKELFQGKAKGFALSKALSATSIRDFDGAISMISYGFDTIEDFYSMMSTRKLVNKVKIPVLFIQSDDGTVPLISVPRSTIAENPFTSLLICSCLPSSIKRPERSAILWCQQLAIEWLAAVELALLKGRHPLLKDVDITINPSKGFAYINEKASGKTISAGNRTHRSHDSAQWFLSHKNPNGDALMNLTQSSNVNGFLVDPLANVNKGSDGTVGSNVDSHSQSESGFPEMQKDTDSTNEGEVGSSDSEDGQVLQTASVVMNMLDVSMPGALDSEQKKKVLTAIEQGETLMKALQGAVPEEVRGKLTGAVTDILQTQGTKLNFGGLKRIGWAYNLMSEKKAKENPTTQSGNDVVHSSNQEKTGVGSDGKTEDGPSNVNSENNTIRESIESSQEKAAEASVYVEVGSEMGGKPSQPHNSEKGSSIIDENNAEKSKSSESNGETDKLSGDEHAAMNDGNDAHNNETKGVESLSDSTTPISASSSEESVSIGASASEYQVAEQEVNGALKNEASSSKDVADHNEQSPSNKSEEPLPQHPSNKPSINVTQALDALTGFDDSTQVAVNSVFGVLEDMIDQFEKVSNNKNSDGKDNAENQELVNGTEQVDGSNNKSDVESDISPTFEHPENSINNETVVSYEDGKRNLNKVNCSLTSSVNSCIDQVRKNVTVFKDSGNKNLNKIGHGQNFPVDLVGKEYWESPYAAFLQRYYSAHLPRMESLDSDSTTDLYHDPERGLWKMIDQEGSPSVESVENLRINGRGQSTHSSSEQSAVVNIVEPSYVILDNEYIRSEHQLAEEYDTEDAKQDDAKTEELICLIKCALLDALKIEVCRRLGVPDLKELKSSLVDDLQQVADEVSQAVLHDSKLNSFSEGNNDDPGKFGTIDGDHIVKTISSAVEDASHLRKVLPVGVIIGSSLASLRKYFQVVPPHDDEQSKAFHKPRYLKTSYGEESEVKEALSVDGTDLHVDSGKPTSQSCDGLQAVSSNNKSIMVGAVTAATAALGASALLAHNQEKEFHDVQNIEGSSGSANGKMFSQEGHTKLEEGVQEKNQNSVVSTLAEKAMSVAAPVVPTNSDGEVDQERLVAVLAELGQKGGMLRLVGKVALLWGGIRGAMSLTDKLISFLHIAERPLFQRVLGFVFMVLVLWSPIVIPLLPTFVQCWTTNSSIGVVKYACIIGLYAAITILIMLWGKRIRGYENPFEQYGLDLPSTSRVHDFLKGLIGGVMIVLCIHSINALLGYASFSLPFGLPLPSAGALTAVKAYGSLLLLAVRGTITATGIGMVEELLFRSWLTTEVAADHGYHNAILISAVAFSLTQRSLRSIPGFLLLSLALFGIKQRTQGKLYASIGLRSGIMTTNFLLQTGGFLSYWPATPFWVASTHPWHPFDGAIGVTTCAILAIFFYPPPPPARVPLPREKKI